MSLLEEIRLAGELLERYAELEEDLESYRVRLQQDSSGYTAWPGMGLGAYAGFRYEAAISAMFGWAPGDWWHTFYSVTGGLLVGWAAGAALYHAGLKQLDEHRRSKVRKQVRATKVETAEVRAALEQLLVVLPRQYMEPRALARFERYLSKGMAASLAGCIQLYETERRQKQGRAVSLG